MDGAAPHHARFMAAKAAMTERTINLVVPLAHEANAMRIADTAGSSRDRSGVVSPLSIRQGDVESTIGTRTLDIAFRRDYLSPVTEKDVTGFGSLSGAAMSRTAQAMRLFCRLGSPSFGRRGGRSRKAHRCSTGLPTPVSVALPFGSGLAVYNRNWSKTMSDSQSAPAPKRVTAQHPFFSCNPSGDQLFAVREHISAIDALEQASCFMATALDVTYQAADSTQSNAVSGAAYLIEMAKAVLDSAISLAYREERTHE